MTDFFTCYIALDSERVAKYPQHNVTSPPATKMPPPPGCSPLEDVQIPLSESRHQKSETFKGLKIRLAENNERRVEATEMDALRRSSRISRKERIRNVTIRQQIGLEETIRKEIEQNRLTWYGHVQRMAEGRLPKIALQWMSKQKRARGRPTKNWIEGIRKAMNGRNLNEGHWDDRKQWSLGVGQRRKTF
jgi:hypothetical protein